MAKKLSYQVLEDNGGGLHLAVFDGDTRVENDSRGGYIFDNNHENSSWILLTLEIYSCIM